MSGTSPRTSPGGVIKGVVFDLDGTLVDSWAVHCRCLRRAARAVGDPEPSAARLTLAQRPTDLDTLRALIGTDRLGRAVRAYRQALREELRTPGAAPAVPHAHELLTLLHRRGLITGVCTGRSRQDARALLDASGFSIDLSVAREDTARPKPAPDGLLAALGLLGLHPDEALYVGDRETDARQGASAGVRTLLLRRPDDGPAPPPSHALTDLRGLRAHLGKAGP
ncbi:HAD family hydrolase [Streptomyces sp. NPDC057052]|uniref:HAD family hydrolase n=1 Tax=Streptomyces sp. NPDC057052 TaxID=3346010 RepID=UPI00363C1219